MTEARGPDGRRGAAHARYTPGAPCWVSLMVHGMAATQDFYGALFGWEFRSGPRQLGPYVRALLDGHDVAGIGLLPPDRHLPVAWTPYFASDDADRTAERVRLCGGTVGVGPLDADDAGRLAICSDPVGAVFGVWQAAAHRGTDVAGVPGAPAWHELLTYETTNVAKFYGTLFGHEVKTVESAGLDRVMLHLDGRPVAGVHGLGRALPRDRGPHWLTYFETADPDAAADLVTDLGGQVLDPPHETGRGRAATVTDPAGARFSLIRSGR